MARTRGRPAKSAPKEKAATPPPEEAAPAKKLPAAHTNPPKLFILPKDTSSDTRIVTLDNPANGAPSRYLFCPEKGFYEFTRIAAPRKMPRSWLIVPEKSLDADPTSTDTPKKEKAPQEEDSDASELGAGYIAKSSDLFIATPIDTLFLLLPALAPKSAKDTKQLFLSLDDHLDTLSSTSRQWKVLLAQFPSFRPRIEKRMAAFCDTVDAGDEIMYRLSNEKLMGILNKKAQKMCKNGLPASMENKFIKPVLEVPILNVKREESSISVAPDTSATSQDVDTPIQIDSQTSTTTTPSLESQSTMESQATDATDIPTPEIEPAAPTLTTPPGVEHLLRLRTCLQYLTRSYIPPTLQHTILSPSPTSTSLPDFTPLHTHLAALEKLRSEAMALRNISGNGGLKRGYEDDEKIAEREEKKRKKEEDEKKKKGESRSIKQLKKVDTSGMKKLSSFFTKAAGKKT